MATWYFRRRLPCYWYATDLNKPPIGDSKMRWPGREPYDGHVPRPVSLVAGVLGQPADRRRTRSRRPGAGRRVSEAHAPHHGGAAHPRTLTSRGRPCGGLALFATRSQESCFHDRNAVRSHPPRRPRAPQPHRDGAHDALARQPGRRAHRAARRVLPAARQRGLIISEGVYPSPEGKGYCRTPGIVTAGQVDAWRAVTARCTTRAGASPCSSCTAGASGTRSTRCRAPMPWRPPPCRPTPRSSPSRACSPSWRRARSSSLRSQA
jgi:hypothetical protein